MTRIRLFAFVLPLVLVACLAPGTAFAASKDATADAAAPGTALVAQAPGTLQAQEAATSGTCGKSLTWTLAAGTLTIEGEGAMSFFSSGASPWYGSREAIRSVVIGDGVTTVGGYAFQDCVNLASVTIPSTVRSIQNLAFYNCKSLGSVLLPEGLTGISRMAFSNCVSLRAVTIPQGVTSIEDYTFEFCSSLESVSIPVGVTSIGSYAFRGCGSLREVSVPDGVTSVGSYAFSACTGLEAVRLPEGITKLRNYTFENCSSLRSIAIPGSVVEFGEHVFQGCASLEHVAIPDGMTWINCFDFQDCSGLRSVAIPVSVRSVWGDAFKGCESLSDVYYAGTEQQWKQVNFARGTTGSTQYIAAAAKHYNYVAGNPAELVKTQAVKPTCTEAGSSAYWTWPGHGRYYADANGWREVAQGSWTIAATGHSWNSGKVTKAATTTAAGVCTYTCTACGKTRTEAIAKLAKKANTLRVKVASKTYKRAKLAKAATFNIGASKAKGKVTYALSSAAKKAKVKVSSKGKVTVPRKCKKGTYKITVKAAGNASYKAGKKIVTVMVK